MLQELHCSHVDYATRTATDEVDDAVAELIRELNYIAMDSRRSAAGSLLDKVECMRRFVFDRKRLRTRLLERSSVSGDTLGRKACDAIYLILGGQNNTWENLMSADKKELCTTTRRATACLTFLGALDISFL